jgi:hypothetical protein
MLPLLLPLLLAAGTATSNYHVPAQCATPESGRCPSPSAPKSAYASSGGLLTAAECCAQCAADGSLCFGWTWSAPGPDGGGASPAASGASKPGGGSCSQFDAPLNTARPASWNCSFGVNPADPPKPLPAAAPKKAPAGAKNVLFLVADDMRPSINPYAIEGEAPRYTTPALDELARIG